MSKRQKQSRFLCLELDDHSGGYPTMIIDLEQVEFAAMEKERTGVIKMNLCFKSGHQHNFYHMDTIESILTALGKYREYWIL